MHGGELSSKSEETQKVIRLSRDRRELPATDQATLEDVQGGCEEVPHVHEVEAEFCLFLHGKTPNQQQGL